MTSKVNNVLVHNVVTDVLIVGAGPAGVIAALNLINERSVLMIDKSMTSTVEFGESMPPAVNMLFKDMKIQSLFEAERHLRCYANQFRWEDDELQETDFLRDPNGNGWHIDRQRFDRWLRQIAILKGVGFLAPVRIANLEYKDSMWNILIKNQMRSYNILSKFVIDAGGRAAPIAKRMGARRTHFDKLICGWLMTSDLDAGNAQGLSYVEAEEFGWWYTAPLSDKKRILAFYTDHDTPSASIAHDANMLIKYAKQIQHLNATYNGFEQLEILNSGYTAAHSSMLNNFTGDGWLAAGDAAMSFDPISSQGLFNALFTGLSAAYSADRYIKGDTNALLNYSQTISDIASNYRANLKACYERQTRWRNSSIFWQRRGE